MSLVFDSVAASAVTHAHAAFEAGVSTVLGRDGVALDELVALAEGELAPRRGAVLVFGAPPAFAPGARRQVVTLRALESLPPAPRVQTAIELVLAARGMALGARELLERWHLADWAERRPNELSTAEQRAIALAIGLGDEQARVLALYEPLATALPAERVRTELLQRAASAVVLAATASLDDARSLGGSWFVLEAGVLDRSATDVLGHGLTNKSLLVRCAEPRRLATLLAADASVSAVEWDEQSAPHELCLHATDASALALLLTRTALEHGIELELVTPLSPSLDALLAARAALMQKAYEVAYQRAQAPVFAAAVPYAAPAEYQSPAAPAPNLSLPVPQAPPAQTEEK